MAALNKVASYFADEIRDGIAWVIIWKTARSWHGYAAWLDPDTEAFEPDDLKKAREVLAEDPNAVMLNGYYCGHFGEDMNALEIAAGIRWHYENGYNLLSDSTALPDEPARARTHARRIGARYEVCGECGLEWNVSKDLVLPWYGYRCPRCRSKWKRIERSNT